MCKNKIEKKIFFLFSTSRHVNQHSILASHSMRHRPSSDDVIGCWVQFGHSVEFVSTGDRIFSRISYDTVWRIEFKLTAFISLILQMYTKTYKYMQVVVCRNSLFLRKTINYKTKHKCLDSSL